MAKQASSKTVGWPMRIQARKGSPAEKKYYFGSALPGQRWEMPEEIAPGINPAPLEDLIFHGGKTVPQMEFQNVYLGESRDWAESDIESIDSAITLAMQDRDLNNVMVQYFPGTNLQCEPRNSFVQGNNRPSQLDEPGVQATVVALFDQGKIKNTDLSGTIFNLILPARSVLTLDDSSSLEGLGGYHGSVQVERGGRQITLYYSANVFSEMEGGQENGIVAFDQSWKNVVATLYHEMNEFRTDADVRQAIASGDNDFLGWMSRSGRECGDQPIVAASSLNLIFQEVAVARSSKRVPVQFLYSNAVHGAEGPINSPHADVSASAGKRNV
ncbi:MAG TPA: hypothetical protein VJQ54_24865 [Candidatus Sulfotelmatobacter sp.]|nr:hypothetical protein [Candidatus Sulfotelmatobacter sp.]